MIKRLTKMIVIILPIAPIHSIVNHCFTMVKMRGKGRVRLVLKLIALVTLIVRKLAVMLTKTMSAEHSRLLLL